MTTIKWTKAFAFSWLIWLGGMAIGFAVVMWTSHLPVDIPEPTPGVLVAEQVDAGTSADEGPSQEELMGNDKTRSSLDLFLFILGRNLTVYVWLLAGLLSAGTITFLVLLSNGIALGQAIGFATWSGLPAGALADLLLPHGVLEVGTFCIAGAVGFQGFRLAMNWSQRNSETIKVLRLGLVLAFGVCALAVAAGVEAVITGELAASLGIRSGGR